MTKEIAKRIANLSRKKNRRGKKWLWGSIFLLALLGLTYPRWGVLLYPLPYHEVVLDQAVAHQVDPWLVFAVIRAESRFDRGAESAAGARGLMQIMPETAQWISQKTGREINLEELYQPELNIELGCWYLSYLLEKFSYQLPAVIAAYNAGPNRVEQWLAEGIWDGGENQLERIPFAETRTYVKSVLRSYAAYQFLN
jgi:soluble lytic murein transglycosylase